MSPRIELLHEVNDADGVQVDSHLQLRDGVYALGDIAKAPNQLGRMRIEHWRVALQYGRYSASFCHIASSKRKECAPLAS